MNLRMWGMLVCGLTLLYVGIPIGVFLLNTSSLIGNMLGVLWGVGILIATSKVVMSMARQLDKEKS